MKTIVKLAVVLLAFGLVGSAYATSEVSTNSLRIHSTDGAQRATVLPPDSGGFSMKLPPSAANSGDVLTSDGSGGTSFSNRAGWEKFTVTHTDLQDSALTININPTDMDLEENEVLEAVVVKHSTAFAGTGITAYNVSIGITSDLDKYSSDFDVFQAVSDTAFQASSVLGIESFSGGTVLLQIEAESTGANLDQSTAGSVDIWIKKSRIQDET